MILKSFGCSFVWGSEMADADPLPSRCSWPALIARHLGLPYQCMARPGGGNMLITEQIMNHVALPGAGDRLMDPAVFVINWTYIDRFDFYDSDHSRWETLRPGGNKTGREHVDNFYYRNLHSQYRDKLATLLNIKLCIDSLQQAGHEFIMTYMDHLLFETEYHCTPAIRRLQTAVRPYLRSFDELNMVEYSVSRGHQNTLGAHPLEAAHQDLFDYALGHFDIDKIKTS
jgi:hypothetical protein